MMDGEVCWHNRCRARLHMKACSRLWRLHLRSLDLPLRAGDHTCPVHMLTASCVLAHALCLLWPARRLSSTSRAAGPMKGSRRQSQSRKRWP